MSQQAFETIELDPFAFGGDMEGYNLPDRPTRVDCIEFALCVKLGTTLRNYSLIRVRGEKNEVFVLGPASNIVGRQHPVIHGFQPLENLERLGAGLKSVFTHVPQDHRPDSIAVAPSQRSGYGAHLIMEYATLEIEP